MATLGLLGQMMLQLPPQYTPYDPLDVARQQNVVQGGRTTNATALIQLEELKRQQEAAALARQYAAAHPQEMLGGGGSTLASLAPGMAPGGAPMTQQAFGPGGMGQAQTVPASPDARRYAGVSPQGGGPIPPELAQQLTPTVTPPQSTLAGLAPQPQSNPLEALMRANPDAARIIQQQQQAQQDRQWKIQEQQLTWGLKSIEAVAQMSQGVTDQASLDQVRAQMQQIAPQAAAQLPQFYSKEAMEAFQQKALSVKERQTLKIQDVQAQAEAVKAQAALLKQQQAGANIPNYTGDATLDAAIYERMKGQPPGTMPPQEVVAAARKDVEEGKVNVARQTGAAQAGEQPLDDPTRQRITAYRRGEQLANQLLTEFTPEERAKFVGMGGMRMTGKQLEAWLSDATKRQADPRFARFLTLLNEAKTEAFATGGKALTTQEADVVFGYIPTGAETSVEQFEQKLTQARTRSSERLDEEIKLATTPKRALAGERSGGSLARPGGGDKPPPGKGGTVKLETLADYAAKHNLPIGKVIKDAYAKGLEIE